MTATTPPSTAPIPGETIQFKSEGLTFGLKQLAKSLGLDPETATEREIHAKVEAANRKIEFTTDEELQKYEKLLEKPHKKKNSAANFKSRFKILHFHPELNASAGNENHFVLRCEVMEYKSVEKMDDGKKKEVDEMVRTFHMYARDFVDQYTPSTD